MLTSIQLIILFLLTSITLTAAEKLFHSRDHSDVEILVSHHAELITDKDSAELFLSKYGFIKPVSWEEVQFEGTDMPTYDEFSGTDFMSAIEESGIMSQIEDNNYDHHSTDNHEFTSALEEFQKVSGLLVTGLFDDATKAAMNKPRCGVPDRETETNSTAERNSPRTVVWNSTSISNDTDSSRAVNHTVNGTDGSLSEQPHQPGFVRRKRHLATLFSVKRQKRELADLGYMAFSKTMLKWRLVGEGYSSHLPIDDQKHILRLAFRMWSEVSPLEFVEDNVSSLDEIDIRLGFGTGRHLGCTQKFDGAGREFAHAWFLGDIHFDDDEHFTAPNTGNGISLLKVAVHEIGHVLGLPHIYRSGSIMQPSYLPQEAGFEMDWLDRKAIQNLYGRCRGRFSTVFDWIRKEKTQYGEVVIRYNTYFMRDNWYWLYENRNNRTRFGDPVAVHVGWSGIPADGVDAYVHVWNLKNDVVYFFKGTKYWKYDSENDQAFTEDPEGHAYPRLISEGFPGVPSPVDTAFYDRRDSHIYFFKGTDVYAFDVGWNRIARSYPKKITSVFPAVVAGDHPGGNLDAAYFSYSHNALFLLKGPHFWRMVRVRDRRLGRSLPYNGLMPSQDVEQHWFDICNVHSTALKMRR